MVSAMKNIRREEIPQQTQNICTTFIQRRPNVFVVGPTYVGLTLYKCYTTTMAAGYFVPNDQIV